MAIDFGGEWFFQLNRVMDLLAVQQKTIAQNVANTNTPGYVRHDVDFDGEIAKIMERDAAADAGAAREINGGDREIEVLEDAAQPARADGNNVNLEREIVDMAKNSQLYRMMTRIASKDIKSWRYVISGGR